MPLIPVGLQRSLVARAKDLLVLSSRWSLPRFAGQRIYDLMLMITRQRLCSLAGVRSLYLCHSMAADECYPGLSDFDLVVVFDSDDVSDFHARMRARWGSLKRYFPINDLSILTTAEFRAWQAIGGGWDPLDEMARWKRIAGEELREPDPDLSTEWAELDRLGWALGHFHNLLAVVLKQEQRSKFMALIARRQLHKSFWHTVLALDPRYRAERSLQRRIAAWLRDQNQPSVAYAVQEMHQQNFISGPVTRLRFDAAALAYLELDRALRSNPLLRRSLPRPRPSLKPVPIENQQEVEERARSISASLREVIGDDIESIMLGSNGSARGYSLYVVLRDGLDASALATVLRDMRAICRVYDDLWLNEHVPGGMPTVCSRAMFVARLQTGRSGLQFLEQYRVVLLGTDLFAEVTTPLNEGGDDAATSPGTLDHRREHLAYSLHVHQVCLARSRPALYELITFYLPRLMLQRRAGITPATVTEAVQGYAALGDVVQSDLPLRMHARYAGRDLDFLVQNLEWSVFDEAWPLLSQGLLSRNLPGQDLLGGEAAR
jgi:hypothetical protein